MKIELIYFNGCPNAARARENVRTALTTSGIIADVKEWEQSDPAAPPYVIEYGSPTVLVDGRDVTGVRAGAFAKSCRVDGAPAVEAIRDALFSAR